MADKGNTYVVHGACIRCNMGLRQSRLILRQTHGVFLRNIAQINAKDCIGTTNIIDFCGCISAENPKTLEMAKTISEKIETQIGENFDSQVEEIFCNGSVGSVKTMECAGQCIPKIISTSWDEVKDGVLTEGNNPVRGTATLKCLYGGVITIDLTGQPEG